MSAISETDVHRQVLELLPMLANGTLADADEARVQAHVQGCAECRDEAAMLQQLFSGLSQEPQPLEADVDAALARVNARIDQEPAARPAAALPAGTGWRSWFSGALFPWVGGAAAAALVFMVGVNWQAPGANETGTYEVLTAGEEANPKRLLIDIQLDQSYALSELNDYFTEATDGAPLQITQQDPQLYRLRLAGDIDVGIAAQLLERSQQLPGYISAALANPALDEREGQ